MKQYRIFHITNAYPTKSNPEYGVFIKEQISSLSFPLVNSVHFVNARDRGIFQYIRDLGAIREGVKGADLVHCHHLFSLFAYLLSGMTSKPIVLSFLNDWTNEVKLRLPESLKHFLCLVGVHFATIVIFKSPIPPFLAKYGGKCVHLPNGVDLSYFSQVPRIEARHLLGLRQDAKYLLFVSSKNRFRRQKRYDIFIDVVSAVQKVHNNVFELVISSETRERTRLFFNAADVHVLTSDYEGSPNSVKEALASGTPVVAHAVGDVKNILKDIDQCQVIEEQRVEAYSDAVLRVLSLDLDRVRLRQMLKQKGYDSEEVAERLKSLYLMLVRNGSY